jgi:endonuclease/exonuclease/phosphatase family metal-dependent hydrolase
MRFTAHRWIFVLALTATQIFAAAQISCGPSLKALLGETPSARSKQSLRELNIGTYNVYNFYQSLRDGGGEKSAERMQAMADAITSNKLDVVVLQEVDSLESLKRFNSERLAAAYRPLLIPGNDGRHVGFLLKKDLPFRTELVSHKATTDLYPITGTQMPIFSRDLPALHVWTSEQPEGEAPLLVLLGTHKKSKITRRGDPESVALRSLQAQAAADIVAHYRRKWGAQLPVLVAGDFNGTVHEGPEFRPLTEMLEDSLDLGSRPARSNDERATHAFLSNGDNPIYNQLDAILLTPNLRDAVEESFVHRYKDAQGNVLRLPRSSAERELNPSDHYPVVLKLRFQRLLEMQRQAVRPDLPSRSPLAPAERPAA